MPPSLRLKLLPLALLAYALAAAGQTAPRTYELNAQTLAYLKANPNAAITAQAVVDADHELKAPAHSVVEQKQVAPSGDKHDWYTQAGYWWKDPANPNGAYIRHDGEKNPEKSAFTDEAYFNHTVKSANTLALAYYLTDDEKYAAHAELLLRTWFLDPATAMNPNLTYAQFVPNKNDGRPAGIVSARQMALAVDAVGLLAGSKAWTLADDAAMRAWFTRYYTWLATSDGGKEEASHPNNHGSWCQAQLAILALYLGKQDEARKVLLYVRDTRIPEEIDAKGMQKYEMARTKSFSYSALNLHALTTLAVVAQPLGIDLYKPTPGIFTAADALLPFDPQHPWPHQQIEANREDSVCPALFYLAGRTPDAKYTDGLKRFNCQFTAANQIVALGAPPK